MKSILEDNIRDMIKATRLRLDFVNDSPDRVCIRSTITRELTSAESGVIQTIRYAVPNTRYVIGSAKLFHDDVGSALSKAPAVALTQQYIPPTHGSALFG